MSETIKPRGWFDRNWKWVVPVGCVGLITVVAGFVFLLMTFIFGLVKSSDAYKGAVTQVKANQAVITSLGTPIEEGMFVTGNINVSGSTGQADLAIPISGPNGSATVYVNASKSGGQWTYSLLAVQIHNTGQRINLLESEPD